MLVFQDHSLLLQRTSVMKRFQRFTKLVNAIVLVAPVAGLNIKIKSAVQAVQRKDSSAEVFVQQCCLANKIFDLNGTRLAVPRPHFNRFVCVI